MIKSLNVIRTVGISTQLLRLVCLCLSLLDMSVQNCVCVCAVTNSDGKLIALSGIM